MKKTKVSKLFGEFVCDDKTLKKYTKRKVYNDYLKTKELGETLSPATAKAIASAIKYITIIIPPYIQDVINIKHPALQRCYT